MLLVQQLGSSASLQPSAEGVQTQWQVYEPQLLRQGDTASAVKNFKEMAMLLCWRGSLATPLTPSQLFACSDKQQCLQAAAVPFTPSVFFEMVCAVR